MSNDALRSKRLMADMEIRPINVKSIIPEMDYGEPPVDEETVGMLMESMKLVGLMNPITVQMRHSRIYLVAGRHRFEAARRLKWAEIMAVELPASDDKPDNDDLAAMAQIAENLHRREITALERAELYARWVEVLQSGDKERAKLIPLERKAIAKKQGIEEAELNAKGIEILSRQPAAKPMGRPKGGVREAARLAGVSERDLRRSIKTASLSPEAKEAAKATGMDNNQSALLEAAKQRDPVRQVEVIQKRAEVVDKPAPSEMPGLTRMIEAWRAGSDQDRVAFKKKINAEPEKSREKPAPSETSGVIRMREAWQAASDQERDEFMGETSEEYERYRSKS